MKAITTRFKGATNSRGARIIASDQDGNRVTVPYRYSGDRIEHWNAAHTLCEKMGWYGRLVCGSTKDGCVFVFDAPGCSGTTLTPADPAEWVQPDNDDWRLHSLKTASTPEPDVIEHDWVSEGGARARCPVCWGYLGDFGQCVTVGCAAVGQP